MVAAAGAVLIAIGIALQALQLVWSIRHRAVLRDETGDPWHGRSLEWSTASPPPVFNFAVLPEIEGEDAYWTGKQKTIKDGSLGPEPVYENLEMPRNSPVGFICAFFATIVGFALIWHIWWLAGAGLACAYLTFVVFAWRDVHEELIPVATVARVDRANRSIRQAALSRLQPAP
jgi:cytochrome o ubiquinol oxidase subunit 1